MKTKRLIGTIIIIVTILICAVACEKNIPESDLASVTKGISSNLEIAYFKADSSEITLTFDREEFEVIFSPILDSLLGDDYVYEFISVVDEDIWGNTDYPALQISLFNIEEGSSYNIYWFDIEKIIGNGIVKYYLKAQPNSNNGIGDWTFITCKGTDCHNGCQKVGKNCSACPNPDASSTITPHCEKTEKQVLEVLLSPIATILAVLIGLLQS